MGRRQRGKWGAELVACPGGAGLELPHSLLNENFTWLSMLKAHVAPSAEQYTVQYSTV